MIHEDTNDNIQNNMEFVNGNNDTMSKIHFKHVDGKNLGDVKLFALSTCGWCRKTRMFLEETDTEYDYVYVDLAEGAQRDYAVSELERYNPDMSFPTIVINGGEKVIIGYEPEELAAYLGIEYEE